jgi:hypothetical protein
MTRLLLAVPLTLVWMVLAACGGDDKPDPRALLAEMFQKVGQEKVVSATLKTSVKNADVELSIDQEAMVEPPLRKGYVKTRASTFNDSENEIYIDDKRAWTRDKGESWRGTTPQRLGLNPESLTATADISKVAKTVELLSDVSRGGRAVYHLKAVLDPKSQNLAELSPSLAGLSSLDTDQIVMEYFVGKSDKLLYGVRFSLDAIEDGEKFVLLIEADYRDYGKAPGYPSDLPR